MKPSDAPTILKTNVIGTKISIHLRAPGPRLDPDASAGSMLKKKCREQRT